MKMARYMLVVLVVGLIFGGVGIVAQEDNLDTDVNVCTQENYVELQTHLIGIVNLFADIVTNNPTEVSMQINQALATFYHYCSWPFTSEANPTGILGPLVLDGELYQVTFVVTDAKEYDLTTLTIVVLEDTCGYLSASFLGTNTVVELFEVNPSFDEDSNCTIMVEIDSSAQWELSFAKLK